MGETMIDIIIYAAGGYLVLKGIFGWAVEAERTGYELRRDKAHTDVVVAQSDLAVAKANMDKAFQEARNTKLENAVYTQNLFTEGAVSRATEVAAAEAQNYKLDLPTYLQGKLKEMEYAAERQRAVDAIQDKVMEVKELGQAEQDLWFRYMDRKRKELTSGQEQETGLGKGNHAKRRTRTPAPLEDELEEGD